MKRSFHRSCTRVILAAAFCALPLFPIAQAQQPGDTPAVPAPPATPPPAAVTPPPAPPDPKLIKQLEAILTHKFTRELNDIFHFIEKTGADSSTLNATDRFTSEFRAGDWKKIREELAQMPPELARKIFGKMLADLTEKSKPNMRLDDVLGLADAVPGEFTGDDLRRIGQLLGLTVPVNEAYWLSDRLRKGTGKLGGTDAAVESAALWPVSG